MKILLIVFVMVFTGFTTSFAQESARFEFKSEVIDFGEITKGSNGVRIFEFKNSGNSALIISNVYSSCGCAVPSWTKTPIQPGESGQIEVKYDTERVGPIRRTITIYSNADEETKAIKIKGRVLDPDAL